MGGGVLDSAGSIAYRNALIRHIKSRWRWLPGGVRFVSQVAIEIAPDGTIRDARLASSSGNDQFDDSVMRAVQAASPVPQAPQELHARFAEVTVTFDSEDR